jgi:NADH:ubiquinone oxidoreductase subunit C
MYQLVLVEQFPIYETFKECFDMWAGLFWVRLCKLLNSFVHYFNVADVCMRLVQRFVASSLLFLKYDSYLQFLICIDLIAYDQPGKKYRFTVIYYLMSLIFNTRLHLVTQVETFQGIETVCTIFSSAN